MRRIRLQVRVEPLEAPSSPAAPSGSRQEKILPWTEPCSEDLPISELWAKIESRFERIYPGRGRLRIKYLQDHYGSVLDTTETVGDIFDDRTGGAELNATSIVRVVRFPPDREELNNPQRFGSIMPESFARPQKRLFSNTQPAIWSNCREVALPEDSEAGQASDGYGREVKRQRLQDATTSRSFDPDRPVRSRESDRGENPQRRLPPIRQISQLHLTEDSQRMLAPRRTSPYGTPTSLSLIDRSNQVSFGTANQDGIPDSPPSKTTLQSFVNLDDDDTKSESPDLGRSLYNVPPSHAGTPAAATELSNTEAPDHDVPPTAYTEPLYTKSTDQTVRASVAASAVPDVGIGVPLSNETSNPTQPARLRTPQPPTIVKDFAEGLSKSKRNLRNSLPRNPPESTSKSRKEPFDMYDPIETDTENSQKQQDRTSSGWAKLGSKEGTQLSPLNDVRKFLTNDDMRPPSLGTDELQSVAIRIHDSEQHHHPLSKILQRNHKNTNLQASATKVHTLMEPPKATSLGVSRKRQESSPKPLSRSVKASEELRDERACQEPPAGVVFDEAIQVKPPITLEKEIQLPEEQLSEKSMRRTQRPKEEAPQKRLERKRKSEELKSPSNTKAELERVAATAEEQKMVLQAKEAGDRERQSEADGDQGKEKDRAEQQKGKKIQEKERNGLSEAKDAKKQEQIEETKAKESKLKEQKNKVLEKKKDSKRLKTEQTTEPNVRQDAGKQPGERTMRTRTPGRKDSQAVKDLRAEMALQEALESCEHGRPKSPTPLSSSGSQETKTKSLTAFYPVTRGSRSSSLSIEHPKPPQETPSRGTKAGERPPLTSALRKSPNSLRRSASSISWANPVAPPDFLKPTKPTATAPRPSGDKLTGSSLITSGGVAVSHTRQPSVEITRTISASPIDTVQKKSRDPPKKTSTNIKKQTKLNVKRDVKLKGRVIDPPSPPKPVVEEALVISSDSNDTVSPFYSDSDDDVQEIRDPKAGPSSKKVKSDIKLATAKVVITPKTQPDSQVRAAQQATVELATPTIERPISSQQAKAVTTAKKLSDSQGAVTQQTPVKHAIPTAEGATSSQQSIVTNTQPKASSRSPARYVSSTPSSTSSASAKSDASAVSSSPPDIAPEPSSKAPLEMKSTPMDNRRGSSVSVKAKDVKATPAVDRRLSSQSSGTRSTQQTQNSDAMSVESAVDQQLQREARQFSEPAQIQVKSSPPTTQSQASKSNSQIRAKPVSTPSEYPYTMSGPRPANFRYPSLTNLRKNPPKYDPKEHLKHASFMLSSQRRDDHKPITSSQPNGVTREDESSSESEDESGSSSDNENDKVMSVRNPFSSSVGSQVSKKSDGRNAKGLSSLVKLAKRHGVNG